MRGNGASGATESFYATILAAKVVHRSRWCSRSRADNPRIIRCELSGGVDSGSAHSDVARLGLVRPPLVYLIALVIGVLVQLAAPLSFVPRTLAVPLGASLVVVAIALFSFSVAKFRAAGTPVPARKPTTAIVRTGPYRFSRNPIYLAFSVFQVGIAIWVNSLWLLATLAGALALIHYVVIPKEEQYLERRFGAEYLDYKASVRRWL
jgi:protein-S-isoprenylcysteine O-methyltransferase Ste14